MIKSLNITPKLRFSEFNNSWLEKPLGSLFERITEKNVENNQNVLTISAQDGLISQEKYFNKSVSSSDLRGYYLLKKGDFAYNKSYSSGYPMGAIKQLQRYERGVVSPLYICFRQQNDSNDSAFLQQYFEGGWINREIAKIAQEGARNHGLLNMSVHDFFNDIVLHLPSKNEQYEISNFLSLVDKWIKSLKTKNSKLKKYRKIVVKKIFSKEIRFKNEKGSNYLNWETKKIGELFNERNDKNGDKNNELLSVRINGGVTFQENTNKIDSSNSNKSKYKVVKINDIAYNTMRMWQGASGVSRYEGIVSPAYTVVYPKKGDPNFYGYLFKHPRVVFDFYRFSQGMTSDTWNLKFKHFSEIPVTVPTDVEEQTKIATFLLSIDSLIENERKQIEQAEKWKKGLLQQMFI